MNIREQKDFDILSSRIAYWCTYEKQILSHDIDLSNEDEVKYKLVIPIIKEVFLFFNTDEYKIDYHFKTVTHEPDICILNNKNELCYIIEVKKYLYSSKSKMTLCNKTRVEQIKGYFNRCSLKPYFILLTNGFDYLFFSNFNNPIILDSQPFYKISFLDNFDYLKLYKFLRIRFYTRSNYIKTTIRNIFYMETDNLQLNLKPIREERGLTQKNLSVKLNCTQQRINTIEKNKCSPTIKLMYQLAKVLDCSIYDLIDNKYKKDKAFNYFIYLLKELKLNAPDYYIQEYLEDITLELKEKGLIPL